MYKNIYVENVCLVKRLQRERAIEFAFALPAFVNQKSDGNELGVALMFPPPQIPTLPTIWGEKGRKEGALRGQLESALKDNGNREKTKENYGSYERLIARSAAMQNSPSYLRRRCSGRG